MTPMNFAFLVSATIAFIAAAAAAKSWAMSTNASGWLCLTLALYTIGNLIMLRLIREVGMGPALSLSALLQLVAVNALAIAVFGERVTVLQGAGIVLAIVAFAMITWPVAGR